MLLKSDVFSDACISAFVDAGYYRYRPNYAWARDCRHCSLYLIAEGSLHFVLADRAFTARKNDVVFLRADEVAFLENNSDQKSELYYIAFRAEEALLSHLGEVAHCPDAVEIFKVLVNDYNSKAPFHGLKVASSLYRILYIVASDKLRENKEYMQYAEIRKAGEYINTYYYKNITTEALCTVAGYSEAQLRRLFSKVYGCSPKTYILNTKILYAKRMLCEEPNKTVDEIAALLSFCSPTYFCYVFKKKVGMSPGAYREASLCSPK